MRNFSSPISFGAFLMGLDAYLDRAQRDGLEAAIQVVEDEAKRVLGTYDYGWPSLAPSTIERKGADTPGVETGELLDDIRHVTTTNEATTGTDLMKGYWFELGRVGQPPRSFLAQAMQRKTNEALEAGQRAFVRTLLGL